MSKPKRDEFDGQLSLPPEFPPKYAEPYVPASVRKRQQQFAQFPMWWWDKLIDVESVDTWALAIHILHRFWRNWRRPFNLANGALAGAGIDRFRKSRALAELEGRGLVKVERRRGKSPIVEPVLRVQLEPGG